MFKNRKYKVPGALASRLSLCARISVGTWWAAGGFEALCPGATSLNSLNYVCSGVSVLKRVK